MARGVAAVGDQSVWEDKIKYTAQRNSELSAVATHCTEQSQKLNRKSVIAFDEF